MNRHLTSEQISEWLAGEYSSEVEQHLADCAACRVEVALFKTTLKVFRQSAHNWADQNCAPARATLRHVKRAPYRSAFRAFCLVGAMLLVCFFADTVRREISVRTLNSESALLQRVNSQIAQDVPSSFAPLDSLVSFENSQNAQR